MEDYGEERGGQMGEERMEVMFWKSKAKVLL